MAELKPCPFCGHKAEVRPHAFFYEKLNEWRVDSYGVVCTFCDSQGFQGWATERDAVWAWNTRNGGADNAVD